MSKKKNKKLKYYNSSKKKSKKASSKKAKSAYKKPRYKDTKPSLTKKEAKANAKIVKSPVDVPKEFLKNRRKCNHAGDMIQVAAYKALTPNYAAYTPMLDNIVQKYGEENVSICRSCYDAVVSRSEVTAEEMIDALTTLYVGVNAAVANRRMKDDEIKTLAKLKETLDEFRPVIEILEKLEDEDETEDSGSRSASSAVNPNRGNGAFVQ